jgi:hypothetical protein
MPWPIPALPSSVPAAQSAVAVSPTATKLHARQLGDQQLQMFDLALVREQLIVSCDQLLLLDPNEGA